MAWEAFLWPTNVLLSWDLFSLLRLLFLRHGCLPASLNSLPRRTMRLPYMLWIECPTPNFICWSINPQCKGIWGLWEVIRLRWGGAPMIELGLLQLDEESEFFFVSAMWAHEKGGPCQDLGRHLDLRIPASRAARSKRLQFKSVYDMSALAPSIKTPSLSPVLLFSVSLNTVISILLMYDLLLNVSFYEKLNFILF